MDAEPFYRKPWFGTLAGLAALGAAYIWALGASGIADRGWTLLLDAALATSALILTLAVCSQFVLPVRSGSERRNALSRLLIFLLGQHGPITFIERGRAAQVRGEQRSGPGVIIVDPTSAAVLRTATRFTRAVGPGVVFTEPGESLAEALDVRRQERSIQGRRPKSGESAEAVSTLALTQDGVPVSADLGVTFMLDPGHSLPPREGRSSQLSPYEVNLQSAERAAYGHAYGDAEHDDVPWAELPLRLVVDLWREEVKRHSLDELLSDQPGEPSVLARMQQSIQLRLASQPQGERRSTATTSKEQQVLSSRGIRILSVTLGNLYLPERMQEQRMARWMESWLQAAELAPEEAVAELSVEAGARGDDHAWMEITASLRRRLTAGETPAPLPTLQLILGDVSRWVEQSEDGASTKRLFPELRRLTSEVDAMAGSPSES